MSNPSNISIENGRIMFKNFAGKEKQYNPAGKRNFCVVIDDLGFAAKLEQEGWKIKYLEPRDPQDNRIAYLQVGVKFDPIPPKIYVVVPGKSKTLLDEETVASLDWAEITNVDMVIRPYTWNFGGKSGVAAYVKLMYVTIQHDEFEDKYQFPVDDDPPFEM